MRTPMRMPRRLLTTVTVVVALSVGAGVGLTACSSTPTAVKVAVVTCARKAVVRPASFVISCADANTYLQKIRWSSWGATSATASATYIANDCIPYCAAGKFISYPATVSLGSPMTTNYGRVFTILRVKYVAGKTTRSFSFSLMT